MEFEWNAVFLTVYAFLQSGLVMPLVNYLKKWLPGTFPVQPVVYTAILSFLVAWLLSMYFQPDVTVEQLVGIALSGHVVSQLTHSVVKTVKKKGKKT